MKLAEKILSIVENKNSSKVTNNLIATFYRTHTEFSRDGKRELFKIVSVPRDKEAKDLFLNLATEIFSKIDFNYTELTQAKRLEIQNAIKNFKERYKELTENELEKMGLGKAPFKFLGSIESPPKSMLEQNPEAYNNALRAFPKFDAGGIGSCARCYYNITIHYVLKSSDGKTFPLGSECVHRLNDTTLTKQIDKEVAKRTKELKAKRDAEKKDKLGQLLNDRKVIDKLRSLPHPFKEYADKGQTLYDSISKRASMSGTSGKNKILKEIENIMRR